MRISAQLAMKFPIHNSKKNFRILVFLLLLLSSCRTLFVNAPQSFVNQKGGYTLDYPPGWVALEIPNGHHGEIEVTGIVVMIEQDSPNVYIRQIADKNPSLEGALKWGEDRLFQQYGELGDLQFEPATNFEIEGMTLAKRNYTITFPEQEIVLKNQDVYLASASNMYILTFSATEKDYQQYIEVFDQIVSSFQLFALEQ